MTRFEDLDRKFFPGFERRKILCPDGEVQTLIGGKGPPLLMLHGDPQTHLCWHRIAPELARDFTVVLTDLRGRGESHKPGPSEGSLAYSKRTQAREQVNVMELLGFERFRLVGHDRGARVSRRIALDFPECIDRLVVMDIIPALDFYENVTAGIAQDYYYFFFLTQPFPIPDDLIKASPETVIKQVLTGLPGQKLPYDPSILDAYLASATRDASVVAMCECFRAGLSQDIHHDRADRQSGKIITCPTLVMWGEQGVVGQHFDVKSIWRQWAPNCTFTPMPCGHFIPEEQPDRTLDKLRDFLK